MSGPLEGIRVLEIANWLAAPAAAALLADMGADVVKVEPLNGDPWRHYRAKSDGSGEEFEINYGFELDNRGKRSITLDLSKEESRDVVLQLANTVDVFITNLIPSRMDRFHLSYEALSVTNPGLVYLSFSGYGNRGPDKDKLGFDYSAFWARSGIMSLIREEGMLPLFQRGGMGDHSSSLSLTTGILAALFERERTGKGQELSGSLFNVGLWVLGCDIQMALVERSNPSPDYRVNRMPVFNDYQTKDCKGLMLTNPNPVVYWPRACRALGRPDLLDNPRYQTIEQVLEHSRELVVLFDEIIATKTLEEWGRILDEHGVIWAPVQELSEVIEDPQARANDYFTTVQHPTVGEYETIDTPVRFRSGNVRARGPAPEIGQHTEEVLLENGYSWEKIASLREAGAI